MRPHHIISLLLLCSCSGLQESEEERIRNQNAKGEFLTRNHNDRFYALQTPKQRLREKYPWEEVAKGKAAKITKDYFRCRGSGENGPTDCGGSEKHSLPLREKKEFIYPILIEQLNYLQEKTGKKVIITCGHRCPVHNQFADPGALSSRHMMGAEVDFYVQGMEQRPEEILSLLMRFYKENSKYAGKKEFEQFEQDNKSASKPWANKEIMIKLVKKNEGRDKDNQHAFPYLTITVRYDRDLNERVVLSQEKATKCYMRY